MPDEPARIFITFLVNCLIIIIYKKTLQYLRSSASFVFKILIRGNQANIKVCFLFYLSKILLFSDICLEFYKCKF